MKEPHSRYKMAAGLVALAASALGLVTPAGAQLNEARIERDATGIFSGTTSGGRYSVTYDDPLTAPHGGTIPSGSGKARVPVKDGRVSSTVRDSDLPGNDAAICTGAERRSTVIRGGKRILYTVAGTMKLDDGDSHGPWTNGTINGTLDDKGVKWFADSRSSARQRNGIPPDHTKRVTGLRLAGKG